MWTGASSKVAIVTLQFIAERDPISWAIRTHTCSDYSHVDLVMPDGSGLLGARAEGGVQIRPVGYIKAERVVRVSYPVANLPAGMEWITKQIGKPYDYEAIGGILLHRDWRQGDSWICSELQARFSEVCGTPWLNFNFIRANWVSPADLLLSPLGAASDVTCSSA